MPVYAGPFWRGGVPHEGWIRVERGRVVDEGEGLPSKALDAVLLDGIYDYHTHVGDAFLRGRRLPHSLDRLVRPPDGLKHRLLAQAKRPSLLRGIRTALQEYAEHGTRGILDFREQGMAGVALAEEARASIGPRAPHLFLLGRPVLGTDEELEDLLSRAAGIGLSAARDVDAQLMARVAQACRRARRPFALHASESRHEPMQPILDHKPDLLIHLVKATSKDLRAVQEGGVAVALCPSSNAFFRLRCPVSQVHRSGLALHFGTDNAMFGNRDLVQEAARAHALAPNIPDEVLLRGLNEPFDKAIKGMPADAAPTNPRLVVLMRRRGRVRWKERPIVVAR